MKTHNLLICPDLWDRLKSEMNDSGFMNRTFPIITRYANGTMCVIQHGDWGRPIGMSLTELRAYVMAHSNLATDESFDLISCYSGSFNKEELEVNRCYCIDTKYPIIFEGFDDNTCTLVVHEIESDEEALDTVDDAVSSFLVKGLSITREAMERIMLLHNYMEGSIA